MPWEGGPEWLPHVVNVFWLWEKPMEKTTCLERLPAFLNEKSNPSQTGPIFGGSKAENFWADINTVSSTINVFKDCKIYDRSKCEITDRHFDSQGMMNTIISNNPHQEQTQSFQQFKLQSGQKHLTHPSSRLLTLTAVILQCPQKREQNNIQRATSVHHFA